jgi:hypothetical protein
VECTHLVANFALDEFKQVFLIFQEVRMIKFNLIVVRSQSAVFNVGQLTKSVCGKERKYQMSFEFDIEKSRRTLRTHVQLTNETGHVVVFEVERQKSFGKLRLIADNETFVILSQKVSKSGQEGDEG